MSINQVDPGANQWPAAPTRSTGDPVATQGHTAGMTSPDEPPVFRQPEPPFEPPTPPPGYGPRLFDQPRPPIGPPAVARRRRTALIVAAAVGVVVALAVGATIGAVALRPAATPRPATAATTPADWCGPQGCFTQPAAPPAPDIYKPTPQDFTLTVKETEKHCFGSAGCNVTFRLDIGYTGARTPSATKTYEVVYRVDGGEDPQTNRFTVNGETVTQDKDQFIQTASSKVVLTATVVEVNEVSG